MLDDGIPRVIDQLQYEADSLQRRIGRGRLSRVGCGRDGSGDGNVPWRLEFGGVGHNLSRVELHQHGPVRFELLHGNGESEVVEEEKLNLQVIELDKG